MKKILLINVLCFFSILVQAQEDYIDLGLPSGTLWKKNNESELRTLDYIPSELPTKRHWEELINSCQWVNTPNGYRVIGPNGNSILLPAKGYMDCNLNHSDGYVDFYTNGDGDSGYYWSCSTYTSNNFWLDAAGGKHYKSYAYTLEFNLDRGEPYISEEQTCSRLSVRLIKTNY